MLILFIFNNSYKVNLYYYKLNIEIMKKKRHQMIKLIMKKK